MWREKRELSSEVVVDKIVAKILGMIGPPPPPPPPRSSNRSSEATQLCALGGKGGGGGSALFLPT